MALAMKTELRPCWYKKGEWKPGLFHEWGTEELENGHMTVGIIETMDGDIVTIPPERVHFGRR